MLPAPSGAGAVVFKGLKPISAATFQRYAVLMPPGVERRIQVRFDAESDEAGSYAWKVISDWSAESLVEVDQGAPGVYSLHVDLRRGEKSGAHSVGQTRAISLDVLGGLSGQVADRVRRVHVFEAPDQWSPQALKDSGSIAALTEAITVLFPSRVDALVEATGGLSRRALLAVHAMNMVSSLYVFGQQDPSQVGCVLSAIDGPIRTPADYLASRIGCCQDFSAVLAAVLEMLGFEHRAVCIRRDHIFNEVMVGGRGLTLDATINTLYTRPYAEVLTRPVEAFAWPIRSLSTAGEHRKALDALIAFQTFAVELYGPDDLFYYDPKVVFSENYHILLKGGGYRALASANFRS
ncbi:transglutaminase domain-containing protein [Caulobacter soli]|uniref:transglutaminase domain-containing protein n=1 Tax=Caulobacter soli TaxID=2708539 RepID=UPI0013EA6FD3|nr:transglutaminase domain-containing protein [Caulobacter soli]